MDKALYNYLLLLGDNVLILGQRLSELCGHGPSLETDIALTNISLDLFGQVRNYFQYAASVTGDQKSEDDIAFLRYEHEYRNALLVEQPNTDFAFVIGRQFLFDAYHLPLLAELQKSKDPQVAAIANKSIKEVQYHLRFSSTWVKRLGGGTQESHLRMQTALHSLWPYTPQLFQVTVEEKAMQDEGIGADLELVEAYFKQKTTATFEEVGLSTSSYHQELPDAKNGVHSEHMGYILTELQYMQRAYPNMTW